MSSPLKLSNNAIGRLAGNISNSATAINLQTGQGALFPTLGVGDYFNATIVRASDSAHEIVKVTARASDTLTVTRAQETTSALAFLAGDRIELRMTAATFSDEIARVEAKADAALPQAGGTVGAVLMTGDLTMGAGAKIVMEGTTDDAFEVIVSPGNPTADRTLELPDKSGTLATLDDVNLMLPKAGGSMTGLLKFKEGAAIESAATVDLTAATGNTVHITGTTPIAAWTMADGQLMDVIFDAATPLTYHATTNKLPGGASITSAAGDSARLFYDGTTVYILNYTRADGAAPGAIASAAEVAARTNNTKPVTSAALQGLIASGTLQATTSGTSIDFNIPSWVKRITVMVDGITTNGASVPIVQLGDSGGIETTGYIGVSSTVATAVVPAGWSSGVLLRGNSSDAAAVYSGSVQFNLQNAATNTWSVFGVLALLGVATIQIGGTKSLSAVLDKLRLTTVNGTDAFDAGSVNILYE